MCFEANECSGLVSDELMVSVDDIVRVSKYFARYSLWSALKCRRIRIHNNQVHKIHSVIVEAEVELEESIAKWYIHITEGRHIHRKKYL